jgi:hypothetical protein
MEELNKIKMSENEDQDPKALAEQVTQQASGVLSGGEGDEGGEGGGAADASSIQAKVQEAMTQGQESGLLNPEQLQDGSLQDKFKEAMEKGQAPSGFLDSASIYIPLLSLPSPTFVTQPAPYLSTAPPNAVSPSQLLTPHSASVLEIMGTAANNPLSSYGNNFGNTIEEKLSPVGNVMGKGFETVGRPVGGVVEPLAGGLMKSGGAFGSVLGVGSGNMDKRNAEKDRLKEELSKEVGGKEQTGENPLGL